MLSLSSGDEHIFDFYSERSASADKRVFLITANQNPVSASRIWRSGSFLSASSVESDHAAFCRHKHFSTDEDYEFLRRSEIHLQDISDLGGKAKKETANKMPKLINKSTGMKENSPRVP